MINSTTTLVELCFTVCTALSLQGTIAVLTGGSAAAYYAAERYQSFDADFVITLGGGADATRALEELGFVQTNGIYSHPKTRYTLDFPPGPLSIGTDVITDYETVKLGNQILYILSATDCARDRLAAFYFWNDFSSLQTAIAVAVCRPVNLQSICDWSIKIGMRTKYNEFLLGIERNH